MKYFLWSGAGDYRRDQVCQEMSFMTFEVGWIRLALGIWCLKIFPQWLLVNLLMLPFGPVLLKISSYLTYTRMGGMPHVSFWQLYLLLHLLFYPFLGNGFAFDFGRMCDWGKSYFFEIFPFLVTFTLSIIVAKFAPTTLVLYSKVSKLNCGTFVIWNAIQILQNGEPAS